MGVAGLLSFIQEHLLKFSVPLNLSKEAKAEKLNVVVDGYGLLYFFLEKYRIDWLNGGRYAELYDLLGVFIRKFQQQNIHLIFVFDGLVDRAKKETSLERRVMDVKEAAKIWNDNNPSSSWARILPFFAEHVANKCIKTHGAEVFTSTFEADFDIGQLCFDRKIFAILANDSDFFIFSIPSYYISFRNLDIDLKSDATPALPESSETGSSGTAEATTSTETSGAAVSATTTTTTATTDPAEERKPGDIFARGFKAEQTAKLLNFPPEVLPVFACLVGNDVTRNNNEVKNFQQSVLPPKSKARSHDIIIAVASFLSARYGNPVEAKEASEEKGETEPEKEKEDPLSSYNFDFFTFSPAAKSSLQSVAKKYLLREKHELEEKRQQEEKEHLKQLALRSLQLAPPLRKKQEKKVEQAEEEEDEEAVKKAQEAEATKAAEEEKHYQSELAKYNESPLVQEIRNRVETLIEDLKNSRIFPELLMIMLYQEFWGTVLLEDLAQTFVSKNCFHSLTPLRQKIYGSIFMHPGLKGSEHYFVNEYIPIMGIASTNKAKAIFPQKNNQSLISSVGNNPEARAEHYLNLMECNTKLMNSLTAPNHFALLSLCTSMRALLKYHPNIFYEWELEAFLAAMLHINEGRKILVLPEEKKEEKKGGKPTKGDAPQQASEKAEGEQKAEDDGKAAEGEVKEEESETKGKKKKKTKKEKDEEDEELIKKELAESVLSAPVARRRASLLFALFQGALFHSYLANQISSFHTVTEADMVEFLLDGRLWHQVYALFSRHYVVSRDQKKASAPAPKIKIVEKTNSNQVLKKIRKFIQSELNGQLFKGAGGGGAQAGGAGRGKHPAAVKGAAKAASKKASATANRFSVLG